MAKVKNSFEEMARAAAERLKKVQAAGKQLTFLPDEDGSAVDVAEGRAPGRPKGARGKVSTQMRDWLAAQGYRMPEDVLAQMAGLGDGSDPVLTVMAKAEMVLSWAYDAQTRPKKGGGTEPVTASGSQRLNAFMQLYTIQMRAADALLPYGAPKASPDVVQQQVVQITVPGAPAASHVARDITPISGGRMMPADVAYKMQQNQTVIDLDADDADGKGRTE